jgi:hypothetical protein
MRWYDCDLYMSYINICSRSLETVNSISLPFNGSVFSMEEERKSWEGLDMYVKRTQEVAPR